MFRELKPNARSYARTWAGIVLMLAGPPLLLALMLSVSSATGSFAARIDICVAVVPGLFGLWLLALPWWGKLLTLVIYLPAMGFALAIWGLLFLCGAFGACL